MPLKFVSSQKGHLLLLHNDVLYSKRKSNKNSITWLCTPRGCKLIIHTDSENSTGHIIGAKPVHDHPSNAAAVKAKIVKDKIKKKASDCNDKPANIISTVMQGIKSPVAALLPKPHSIARAVQRVRVKTIVPVINPHSRGDLILSNEYKYTHDGQLFLLQDSGGNKNRILVFTTAKNFNYLTSCNQWLSDGTFKCVPSIFHQLYTIHGCRNNKSLPLVYLLAPNKSESIYVNFLKVLQRSIPNFSPNRLMVDFEKAFINAFKICFPDTQIVGCYFHLCQAIWRHVQACGLQKKYDTNIVFAKNVRMLMALAFVPPADVIAAFEELILTEYYDKNSDVFQELLDYFEATWIGKPKHNHKRREAPFFAIKIWNQYLSVNNDLPPSNNLMEGWHSGVNKRTTQAHASIAAFINFLKEQTLTDVALTQINTGLNVAPRCRKAYRNHDDRVKIIVNNYDKNNKIEYISNIAKILIVDIK